MSAAVPGTTVPSTNPNTQTNTSLSAGYPAADSARDTLMVMEVSGDATGTGVAPSGMAASGWTKVGEKADTNTGTASSSSYIGLFWKIQAAGSASGNASFAWSNAGQMESLCTPYTNFDPGNPVPYSVFAEKTASDANYSISDTTGTAQGLLAYGFANRAGSTAFSGLTDNARGSQVTVGTTGCTMIGRVTAAELAGGTAFTKTATGTNTSVGVSWAYTVKGLTAVGTSRATSWNVATGSLTSVTATRSTSWNLAGPVTATRATTWTTRSRLSEWLAATPLYVAHRGGDNDWVEMTRDAYTHAIANGATAINIDAVKCSTGEFVASHDLTTGRVFGTNLTIGSSTWTALSGLTTSTGGFPIEKVADLLAAFPNVVVFVENKGNSSDDSAFLDMLDAAGGPARIVVKQYYTASTVSTDAHARGYTTWGYYFAGADVTNLPTTQSRWDLLGLDYTDTTPADWTAIKSYGKPVLGHVIPSAAGATQAFSEGADGIMTGKVLGVIPGNLTSVTASRATSWTAAAAASASRVTAWSVLTPTTANRGTTWATLASVTSSRVTTWTGAASVTGSRATTWRAAAVVTASRATTWTQLATAAASRGTTWATTQPVPATRATTWAALSQTTASRGTAWATLAAITSTRATAWSTTAPVTSSRQAAWTVLTPIIRARATSWTVSASLSASRATTWNVAGNLTTVTTSRVANWTVATFVATSRVTTWAVRTAVAGSRSTAWVTATAVTASRSTTWATTAPATAVRATAWTVTTATNASRATTWATAGSLTVSRPETWATRAAVAGSRTTVWAVTTSVTAAAATTWAVAASTPTLVDLIYSVTTGRDRWHVTTGSSRWTVTTGASE